MAKLKEILDAESQRSALEQCRVVRLYAEGTFYRAYEWSAWLSLLPLTESKERQRRDEIPPTRVNQSIYARKRNNLRA